MKATITRPVVYATETSAHVVQYVVAYDHGKVVKRKPIDITDMRPYTGDEARRLRDYTMSECKE